MNQVFPLLTGYLGWAQPSLDPVMHPVYAYLIVTAGGASILVDSGNPRSLVGQPRALPWFDAPLSMGAEDDLTARLAGTGRTISDIDLLVATHFDFDHSGNTDLFDDSGIQCFVQAALLDDAMAGDRSEPGLWNRPGVRYVSVTATTLAPGITLLESSGHATGHQSLLVEIENGSLLLAVDAIPDAPAMGSGPFPSFYIEDRAAWQRSRDKLLDLAASSGATVIFGHDPAQAGCWRPLRDPCS